MSGLCKQTPWRYANKHCGQSGLMLIVWDQTGKHKRGLRLLTTAGTCGNTAECLTECWRHLHRSLFPVLQNWTPDSSPWLLCCVLCAGRVKFPDCDQSVTSALYYTVGPLIGQCQLLATVVGMLLCFKLAAGGPVDYLPHVFNIS